MKFATYHAIQVVRNHDCPEPVTIGVLVFSDKQSELRLLGALDSGQRGKGEFGHAFPDLVDADLIYLQWAEWFKRQANELKIGTEKVLERLSRLQDRGETIIASVIGKLPMGDTDSLSEVADQLYGELVMVNPLMQKAKFLASIDELLTLTEIRSFDGLIKDAEVELLDENGKVKQLVNFPLLWNSGSHGRFACMLMSANKSPRQISASVANVMATFGISHQYNFTSKEKSFVLADNRLPEFYEDLLGTVAKVICISDLQLAVRDVRAIFFKQGMLGDS